MSTRSQRRMHGHNRSGLSREAAIGLKEWFIKSVPPAVSGSVTPERNREGASK